MPRYRMIKPQIWSSEQFVECSANGRLMFIGMLNFADDNGIIENRPRQLKMQIFPADNLDVAILLEELKCNGLVIEYVVKEKDYLFIVGFPKHQKIDKPTFLYPIPPKDVLKSLGYDVEIVDDKTIIARSSINRRIVVERSTN